MYRCLITFTTIRNNFTRLGIYFLIYIFIYLYFFVFSVFYEFLCNKIIERKNILFLVF